MSIRLKPLIFLPFFLGASLFADEANYKIFFLVHACGIESSELVPFLKKATKHPRDLSKDGSVGHAWIALEKKEAAKTVFWEGGHSGELGIIAPTYWDSLLLAQDQENPAAILWEPREDGFFQRGSGGHHPTCVAACSLDSTTWHQILHYIKTYDFSSYSLTDHHCVHFVIGAGRLCGLEFNVEKQLTLPSYFKTPSGTIKLWNDPVYTYLPLSMPDTLEIELKKAIERSELKDVTKWYLKKHLSWKACWKNRWEGIKALPNRTKRWLWTLGC